MEKKKEYLKEMLENGKRKEAPQGPAIQHNVSCEEYVIENGVLTFMAVNSEYVVIPEGLLEIGERAFYGCKALKRIDLPESLRKIGSFAFKGCYNLEDMAIPAGVTEIGYGAFEHCRLRSVVLPEKLQVLDARAFCECESLESVVLPAALSKISYDAFLACTSLKRLELPEMLLEIGASAFCDCRALTDVLLPGGLRKINKNAFSGCKSICQITIPEGVLEIPEGTFSGCTQLRRVVLPQGVTRINRYAFDGCENLEYVECTDPDRFKNALIGTPFWRKYRPGTVLPVRLPLDLVGYRSGELLRQRGYTFFDPKRSYTIEKPGEDGVVEVHSWSSEDPADEDGYGEEDYYDWWYLDEALQEIPGVSMIPDRSYFEKRNNWQRFAEERGKAAEEIRRRNQ